jgi:hypothetical protein
MSKLFFSLLISFEMIFAFQFPSAIQIKTVQQPPYIAGDTINYFSIDINQPDPFVDTVYFSTNLFSKPTQPKPIIFTSKDTFTIKQIDTSWKVLSVLSNDKPRDTVSFIAFYAPFNPDSVFYINIKFGNLDPLPNTFNISQSSLGIASQKRLTNSYNNSLPASNIYNFIGRKLSPNNHQYNSNVLISRNHLQIKYIQ